MNDQQIKNEDIIGQEGQSLGQQQYNSGYQNSSLPQVIEDNSEQDSYLNTQLNQRQYQTQNVNKKYLQRHNIFQNKHDQPNNDALIFSSSFDESAPQLDLKPQRNCKSSTRMMNKTQNRNAVNPIIQVPSLVHHNMSSNGGNTNKSAIMTAGSINRSQGAFNNYMKNKQLQNTYQQAILNQLQRGNAQNSFDIKNIQDLSNRSELNQTPNYNNNYNGSNMINSSYSINQYFGQTSNLMAQNQIINNNMQTLPSASTNKPITPHNISISGSSQLQQIIMSAGSQMNPRNSHGISTNSTTMDPYAYLRQKQQKYKSCRSNHQGISHHSNPYYKQNTHVIANSAYLIQQKKGNQTQKTHMVDKSRCSSSGSALGSASMTTTMTGIKSLSDVKNPSMFISWRFCDKKLTDLKDIGQFKNLTDLDISGNLLQEEIIELRQLQFLKKLNLSNNQIAEIYPLPHNLEFLNLSNNLIKKIPNDISIHLKNLTTLDICNNQVEEITGLSNMKRLKRFIAKNNLIASLRDLKEISSIIEIDLESNPIEEFHSIFEGVCHKPDILVLNLKMTPATLMIQNYEQLISDLNQQQNIEDLQNIIEWFKAKLKFYNNGCLFRTKRVFIRIKTLLQHSKRSSSNFSNESSSCGRHAANTGGRYNGGNGTNTNQSFKNNTSNIQAFSPILNNTVTTPNYQFITQRQEDIEQLYDEILDEEEDHERKQSKLQKRKQRRESGCQHLDDSQDDDEDLSFYEDEEGNDPLMSCDEDLDYLQSYRNQNGANSSSRNIHENALNHHDILNESTADFNKEIRQINQELYIFSINLIAYSIIKCFKLRDQLGSEYLNEGAIGNLDHVKSLHSTQSVSTNKKNPISFKLDLSKCTQQQSEEEDFENNIKGSNDPENEDQFDIPGLNFVKVTDDSFRQLQKQQSVQQSLRQKLEKIPSEYVQNETQKNTTRDQKPQIKQIVIPKLQLAQLQSKLQNLKK